MQIILDALAAEKIEREKQTGHGTRTPAALAAYEALDELADLLAPFAKAWETLGRQSNVDALDDTPENDLSGFQGGMSHVAHRVLRVMAEAETKAADL